MSIRNIKSTDLKDGMVLALPMGRTATIQGEPKIGTKFVSFVTEYGKSRVSVYDHVLIVG